jgi:hypothetical protein
MSIAALVDSLQIFLSLKPNQFSASGTTSDSEALLRSADRTRCLIETNDFERQTLTNIESWLVAADVSYAIANLQRSITVIQV